MALHRHEVEAFLDAYAKSLTAGDMHALAAAWHTPSLVIAHDGRSVVVASAEQVAQLFRSASEQYRNARISLVERHESHIEMISEHRAHATVTWALSTAAGHAAGQEKGFYVVSETGRRGHIAIDFFAPG